MIDRLWKFEMYNINLKKDTMIERLNGLYCSSDGYDIYRRIEGLMDYAVQNIIIHFFE